MHEINKLIFSNSERAEILLERQSKWIKTIHAGIERQIFGDELSEESNAHLITLKVRLDIAYERWHKLYYIVNGYKS